MLINTIRLPMYKEPRDVESSCVVSFCSTCGYQLSEETLLVGIFIGNFVQGGVRNIAGMLQFSVAGR